MDDVTIRVLLSRFIRQALLDARAETIDDDQFAEAVASAAWNSLIYLLRQSFVQKDRLTLQELGEFVRESGSWQFHPAASLAEADAFQLPAMEGRMRLARLALFHLDQGRDLARSIPRDVENPRAPETWKYTYVKTAGAEEETLAGELRKAATEIFGISRRLSAQENVEVRFAPPPPVKESVRRVLNGVTGAEAYAAQDFEVEPMPKSFNELIRDLEELTKPKHDKVTDAAADVLSADDQIMGE